MVPITTLRRGVTLVEATIALGLFAVVLAAILPTLAVGARLGRAATDSAEAIRIAEAMLAHLESLPYDDPTLPGGFGPEAGEGSEWSDWDDIDDAEEWKGPAPGLDAALGWVVVVEVVSVVGSDPTIEAGSDQGLRRIDVSVLRGEREVFRASTLRSRAR